MNLDSRPDRWKQFTKDFKRLQDILDIEIERISAIKNSKSNQSGTNMTFKKIIRLAIEKDLPYILILEDDLFIVDPEKVKQCLNHVPDDWDLLSGGSYIYSPKNHVNDHWLKFGHYCSLHFVIVRNTIYNKILDINENTHIDRKIGRLSLDKQVTIYVMYPMPCQQRPGYSDIKHKKVDYSRLRLPWVAHPCSLSPFNYINFREKK